MHYFNADSGEVMTVSTLNQYIKNIFDDSDLLRDVTLCGEISNFKHHSSGHLYFSLKDEQSILRAVMFRSDASTLRMVPQEGMKVIVHGRVAVFLRDGQYQIYIREMVPDGVGALYQAFERLKTKLEAEGLFAQERKKRLPDYPMKIGIITSATGAAICDMRNILSRRFPMAQTYLCPAEVQGRDAPASLLSSLRCFEEYCPVDVIIIGRGGGSIEDLWAFNDETLARAIAACRTPVISAVGHESDFTICDFVADLRAPTPSAAAELSVPDRGQLLSELSLRGSRFTRDLCRAYERAEKELKRISSRVCFGEPETSLYDRIQILSALSDNLCSGFDKKKMKKAALLGEMASKMEAMSPLKVLSRGYCTVTGQNGKKVEKVADLSSGERVELTFLDGRTYAFIEEKS